MGTLPSEHVVQLAMCIYNISRDHNQIWRFQRNGTDVCVSEMCCLSVLYVHV